MAIEADMLKSALSGLTTRGRCLLAAGIAAAICALVLDERDLLQVAVFAVVLPLVAAGFAALSRRGVTAERTVTPRRVAVDDIATASLRLHGGSGAGSRIPAAGLLIEDTVPEALRAGGPRFVAGRPPASHDTVLHYSIRPAVRGIHPIGPLHARVSDPFGLATYTTQLAGQTKLVVVPRTVTLTGLPTDYSDANGSEARGGSEATAPSRRARGSFDVSVRQYRYGDDLRRVHWPSTAHRDELMVRTEEQPWHGGTTVLLDHRGSAHTGTGAGSSLEWAVSFAASVCLHLQRSGSQVRLVTDDGAVLTGSAGEAPTERDSDETLDALAALRPSHRRDLSAGGYGLADDSQLIVVLGTVAPSAVREMVRRSSGGGRHHAVLLDIPAWSGKAAGRRCGDGSGATLNGPAAQSAQAFSAAGWSAVVVGPSESIESVWSATCRHTVPTVPPRTGRDTPTSTAPAASP